GTKAMIRFGFDPKPLFQGLEFFGAEDLKLYGELSMLGLKDYGVIYPDLKRRMPMMLGFNVPTFRLLDFLSVEVEYWWQKYSNNYSQTYWAGTYVVPHPYLGTSPKAFPWYWSVFAQKTLTKGVKLMAEATRNHYFTIAKMPFYQDRCESTPSKGDWLYTGRVQFEF
ncbi:MAG: hypothetical protein MUF22_01510, partial [Chitinispirillaceae bacterium]|nr:hypothetical protein [Chitinispirillaceae bacterium]